MSGNQYDAVVVGCGTGGAAFAIRARKLGLSVCVVDTKPRARIGQKVCGDAVPSYHFDRLEKEAGIRPPSGDELGQVITGMKLIGPSRIRMVKVHEDGYTVNRHEFGQRLVNDVVDAGANLLDKHLVLGPIVEKGRIVGLRTKDRITRMERDIRASVVVDASGVGAVLRKAIEFPGRERGIHPRDLGICYREVLKLKEPLDEPDILEVIFDRTIAQGGYIWVFPKSDTIVNVGVGLTMSLGTSPLAAYRRFIKRDRIFNGAEVIAKGGGLVPMRKPVSSFVGDRLLLVGDSACQVNPLHGGGLGYSMIGGCMAANTVAEALARGDVSYRSLWDYNHEYQTTIGKRHAALDVFRIMLNSLSNRDLDFGCSGSLFTEEDFFAIDKNGKLELTNAQKVIRGLRGLHHPTLMRSLMFAVKRMKALKELYIAYPTTPEGLDSWNARVDEEYEPIWQRFSEAFEKID